ncbi:TonB-dependent receptor [Paraglaciecola sp. MB-3u-78]|uniref:TonB-dependent receptor n=1 Tax=Paraglaciecola sp. MB-3u-78 TaxID=2058332 RepID=UPI000C34ED48|nr:TonB-dependent receptor [Paraglaciecola sp. MB-3u-78]PKH00756.1 TonB-dependent receptor [Paraglaciecola sp. MB-3u-78]
MFNLKKSITALAVSASLGMSAVAYAGNNDGSLKGSVVDTKNMAVAGATITIRNNKTGYQRSVVADENGDYSFITLPVGQYVLTTIKDGFSSEAIENINIRIGETRVTVPMAGDGFETIEVIGSRFRSIDTTSSESSLNIGAVELARLPIARNSTAVALLAPGTTQGDNRFGNLASFGGASVAENAYFVNGLNVSNFRNGLGGSTIPFEFYKEFQVKTGGYSAEFGRSTGGVINAVTKSGSNEWEYGANVYYTPEDFSENNPNIRNRDGSMKTFNEGDSFSKLDANIYLSGPLIKDTLFFYVMYNPRDIEQDYAVASGTELYTDKSDDAFWGGKIDWQINADHLLEFTGFSDERTTTTFIRDYDYRTGEESGEVSEALSNRGGSNYSLKYTGYMTDDFVLSALYGKNEADLTDQSAFDTDCPLIISWDPSRENLGCWANTTPTSGKDTREAFRIDGEMTYFDDHQIRFGYDSESNTSTDLTFYSGNRYYAYYIYEAGDSIDSIGYTATEDDTRIVRDRNYRTGGEFDTLSNAFYIEDTWTVSDTITATIGVRSESFNNKNAEGESFIKVDNQIAPRLGISWDVNGDGDSKLYANYGRYHLPIAANTNIRMAGAELFTQDYYILDGLNGDDTPQLGEFLGGVVNSDGTVPDPAEVLDTSVKPMFQDELILGYQTMLNDDWSFGVKFTLRDLGSVIDDITIDKAIRANGWNDSGSNVYVLTNPNTDITVSYDTDGDGTLEEVQISAADLGYPEPKRKWVSWDFVMEKQWDDVWSANITYTWAHNYGNAEGYVKSDNGQDDAGLTTDWDFPYLMDGANGNLPNDRRHTIKAYGSYAITENLLLGVNWLIQSGRPINGFGEGLPVGYGDENDEYAYGQTYFVGDEYLPRGSFGRTAWKTQLDLSLQYTTEFSGADVTLQADLFNVFDSQAVIRVDEDAESGGTNTEFLMPISYQAPRYVMFSASFRF